MRLFATCLAFAVLLGACATAPTPMGPPDDFAAAFAAADSCTRDGQLMEAEATRMIGIQIGSAGPRSITGAEFARGDANADTKLSSGEFLALTKSLGATGWAFSASTCP